jgi:hypothetical protein
MSARDPHHLPVAGEEAGTPPLCKWLRAKTHGVHGDRDALWALRDDASAIFWCLLTMSPTGPDDRLVHVRDCGTSRICATAARDDGTA